MAAKGGAPLAAMNFEEKSMPRDFIFQYFGHISGEL